MSKKYAERNSLIRIFANDEKCRIWKLRKRCTLSYSGLYSFLTHLTPPPSPCHHQEGGKNPLANQTLDGNTRVEENMIWNDLPTGLNKTLSYSPQLLIIEIVRWGKVNILHDYYPTNQQSRQIYVYLDFLIRVPLSLQRSVRLGLSEFGWELSTGIWSIGGRVKVNVMWKFVWPVAVGVSGSGKGYTYRKRSSRWIKLLRGKSNWMRHGIWE